MNKLHYQLLHESLQVEKKEKHLICVLCEVVANFENPGLPTGYMVNTDKS